MKFVQLTALALLLLGAAFVIANLWDDELDPRAAAILAAPPPEVAESENLHTAVSAFGTVSVIGGANRLCRFGAEKKYEGCLASVAGPEAATLPEVLRRNAELEQRYLALQGYRAYSNPDRHKLDAPSPPWGSVLLAQNLHFTRLAVDAVNGVDVGAALDKDHRFWRELLRNPGTGLLEKMVSNAALRTNLMFAGELLRSGHLAPASAHAASILEPFSEQELSMRRALELEFQTLANGIGKLDDPDAGSLAVSDPELEQWRSFGTFFYLPNATVNSLYKRTAPLLAAAEQPCAEPSQEVKTMHWGRELKITDYLRNAVGNILVAIGSPNYNSYLERQCDLEGLHRIVRLQATVADTDPAQLAAAIASAGDVRLDPYTGEPMAFGADNMSVEFSARDRRFRDFLPWRLAR